MSAMDDDYEAGTRALACQLFGYLFGQLAGHLDDDTCRTLYPDLLKRLDDNSDPIRVRTTTTLRKQELNIGPSYGIRFTVGSVQHHTRD